MAQLLHDLIINTAWKNPQQPAIRFLDGALDYGALARRVETAAQALLALGIKRGDRIAVLLDKRAEALLAMFGALAAGAAFVPVDPMLKGEQVALILRDCGARVLVTTPGRCAALAPLLARCPDLGCVLQTGAEGAAVPGLAVFGWDQCMQHGALLPAHRALETDMAALLYTCGSSGRPRAAMLSHRGMLEFAGRLGRCLGQRARQRSLALLPLSDGGSLGLLASTFAAGGAALLVNQVLARELPALVGREAVTSMAAPPWLWMQVAALDWQAGRALRCITSAGGTLPRPTLAALQRRLPLAQVFLMHEHSSPGTRAADESEALVPHPGAGLYLLDVG